MWLTSSPGWTNASDDGDGDTGRVAGRHEHLVRHLRAGAVLDARPGVEGRASARSAAAGQAELLPSRATGAIAAALDFSLFYFSSDEKLRRHQERPRTSIGCCWKGRSLGIEHGFEAVWTPERHFHDFGGLYPNPSVISAAIAASHRSASGFGPGAAWRRCTIPFGWPKTGPWSTTYRKGGSASPSPPAGNPTTSCWIPRAYADRKSVMFDRIDQVQALWRGETLAFDDAKGGQTEVRTLPRPVQNELPVWITAAGNPETFRMAGARGIQPADAPARAVHRRAGGEDRDLPRGAARARTRPRRGHRHAHAPRVRR